MDQQKILNKGITILEIQVKSVKSGNKYALKDHEGKTFNFFTTKQDGTNTQAYAQFKNLDLKVGSTVTVGYVEDEFEVEGKKVISKKIISFRELNTDPAQTAPQAESGRSEANNTQYGNSNGVYGRRLAIHGMVNGLLANGATIEIVVRDLPALLRLEDTIEKALNEVRPVSPIEQEELPVIQQEDYPPVDLPDF